jgi:nucleotidyltransferase/DNA polymerase involved in DNA repair
VAAASYEARKFGVRSAMPSVTAKRQCPDLIFVKPGFEVYKAVSQQIRDIFADGVRDRIRPHYSDASSGVEQDKLSAKHTGNGAGCMDGGLRLALNGENVNSGRRAAALDRAYGRPCTSSGKD